ncbi:MAG: STAS domain-containing protein [bacterium]|nr:STAS domain-containing protein [bacterium]
MDVEINATETDEKIVIFINGDIEMRTLRGIKEKLFEITKDSDKDIEIDFSGVDYVDSSGIGILLSLSKTQKKKNKLLQLSNLSDKISRILQLSSLIDDME